MQLNSFVLLLLSIFIAFSPLLSVSTQFERKHVSDIISYKNIFFMRNEKYQKFWNECVCMLSHLDSLQPYRLQSTRLVCTQNFLSQESWTFCHFYSRVCVSNLILFSLFSFSCILLVAFTTVFLSSNWPEPNWVPFDH